MSTKRLETCAKCTRNVLPTDAKILVKSLGGYLKLWRYECDCGFVWANELQRAHNEQELNKFHKVVSAGSGWYS